MKLLKIEKYRGIDIRLYLMANMLYVAKIKLPTDNRYYEANLDGDDAKKEDWIRSAKWDIDNYYDDVQEAMMTGLSEVQDD